MRQQIKPRAGFLASWYFKTSPALLSVLGCSGHSASSPTLHHSFYFFNLVQMPRSCVTSARLLRRSQWRSVNRVSILKYFIGNPYARWLSSVSSHNCLFWWWQSQSTYVNLAMMVGIILRRAKILYQNRRLWIDQSASMTMNRNLLSSEANGSPWIPQSMILFNTLSQPSFRSILIRFTLSLFQNTSIIYFSVVTRLEATLDTYTRGRSIHEHSSVPLL